MTYLSFCRLEAGKTVVIFEINSPDFVYLQNFAKRKKMSKFETKNTLFAFFLGQNLKKLLSYLKSAHFVKKNKKISNFGTKSTLFWYFGARTFKKLMSKLKSTASNLSSRKTVQKKATNQ